MERALWQFHPRGGSEGRVKVAQKAWQLGSPGTMLYGFYDWLRARLNLKLVRYLLSAGLGGRESIVLEAGSGPAYASTILARDDRVKLSLGADIDLEALQEARRRDAGLTLVVADLMSLPFKDDSVDLCWNSSTIEHLDDPAAALKEMARVTKRGGRVFVGVPNLYGPLGFQRWIDGTSAGVWIGKTFSRVQLRRMMAAEGLDPRDSIYYFFRFFVGVTAEKVNHAGPQE